MNETYFLRIKKGYAAAVIEDLEKMEAVEVIDESNFAIPQWQVDRINAAKENALQHPESLTDWNNVRENIQRK